MIPEKIDRRKFNGGKSTGRKPKEPGTKAKGYPCSLFPHEKISVDKKFGSVQKAVRWALKQG